MDIVEVFKEATSGSIYSVFQMAIIVIPIMIIMQIAEELDILAIVSKFLGPMVTPLGVSKEGALPFLVGLFFGITYGAGVIIPASKDGKLTKKEILLITIFLSVCHALVEDTMIFVVLGANGIILVLGRLAIGIVITLFANKILPEDKSYTKVLPID